MVATAFLLALQLAFLVDTYHPLSASRRHCAASLLLSRTTPWLPHLSARPSQLSMDEGSCGTRFRRCSCCFRSFLYAGLSYPSPHPHPTPTPSPPQSARAPRDSLGVIKMPGTRNGLWLASDRLWWCPPQPPVFAIVTYVCINYRVLVVQKSFVLNLK